MKLMMLGGSAGDEGKAAFVSRGANKGYKNRKFKIVVKSSGPNCGHTVVKGNRKYGFRMLPSAVFEDTPRLLLGAGSLVNADILLKEIELNSVDPSRVGVDYRATLLTQEHIDADKKSSTAVGIGSTLSGCSPCGAQRVLREAKLVSEDPRLKPFLTDVAQECMDTEDVLIEGAQGFMLDLLYGAYPHVTGKMVNASALAAEIGLGPKNIDEILIVIKSFFTRVGTGPMPGTELTFEDAKAKGLDEYGTVTGRKRRVSLDLGFDSLRYCARINTATGVCLSKLDAIFPETKGLTDWSKVSEPARNFVFNIEKELNLPVTMIGTGPDTENTIIRV